MDQSIFVISDLHLGGAAANGSSPGFQMCSPAGRARLAEFIRWVGTQRTAARDVELILAGDIVDFLAEEPFAAFTGDDRGALAKLTHILNDTAEVWEALSAVAGAGVRLTLMLGNHDIELSLPSARRAMLDRLGAGRIEFVDDNEAVVRGPVMIEHGNRYDAWNVIPYDALRAVRSALSRGEKAPPFPSVPGSELVVRVINLLKAQYGFVDLLKPETDAALPLLAVLDPRVLNSVIDVYRLYRQTLKVEFNSSGIPDGNAHMYTLLAPTGRAVAGGRAGTADGGVGGAGGAGGAAGGSAGAAGGQDASTDPESTESGPATAEARLELAKNLAERAAMGSGPVSLARTFVDLWRASRAQNPDEQLDRLYHALRALTGGHQLAFAVDQESPIYMRPAMAAAARGFEVIIFGHTHLAKRVYIAPDIVYLNTGTWADLMRIPDAALSDDPTRAKASLASFADDLAANRLTSWRRQVATYARVDLSASNAVVSADIYLYQGGGRSLRVPDNLSAVIQSGEGG